MMPMMYISSQFKFSTFESRTETPLSGFPFLPSLSIQAWIVLKRNAFPECSENLFGNLSSRVGDSIWLYS